MTAAYISTTTVACCSHAIRVRVILTLSLPSPKPYPGRLLLAQLVLNALALRMAAPGAHPSPASRTNGHTHSRRSRLKHVQRRGRWPNATSVARRGYCEVTSRKGDCRRDDKGYWTGVADLAQCAERCRGCANCRYASFSWALNLTLTLTLTLI